MKIKLFLIISIMTIGNIANVMAQNEQDSTEVYKIADPVSLGLGFGQDYGGLGANFLVYPQDNIGFFFGGGYAIAGFGYNVGAKIRFFSKTNPRTNFFITGMYGYNAAIKVQNASEFDKLFYGPTIGFGLDTGKRSYRNGYWSFALLIPFRSSAVQDYFDDLEDNHGVQFENELLPISFSIGYRFRLN